MDQTATASTTTVTAEYLDKLYHALEEIMLGGLDRGEITVEQSKEISKFSLDHMDKLHTHAEIVAFLSELASKWPIYKSALLQFQDDHTTQEKIEEIQQNISQLNNQ